MSIWCSWLSIGEHDDYDDPTDPLIDGVRGGHVLTYAAGFSNHHPDLSGSHELPAEVGIDDIAPWCVPGHNQDGERYTCTGCGDYHDHPQAGEWVRLTVSAPAALSFWGGPKPRRQEMFGAVVMDENAARRLAADLIAWADKPKVRPLEDDE